MGNEHKLSLSHLFISFSSSSTIFSFVTVESENTRLGLHLSIDTIKRIFRILCEDEVLQRLRDPDRSMKSRARITGKVD